MFLEGFFMDLDVSKKTQRQLFLNKTYEPHISAYIRRNLKPGDYFMDIGANVGYYTMIAAVLVGDRGRVVSFEPEKDNFSRIRHNTDINGFTRCILENMAISDKSGKAVLHINPLNEGGHSLNEFGFYNDSLERWPKEEIERKFPAMEFEQEVACASIDDYMRENSLENPVPTVVKIDVEGFEMNVLKGMKILLMRFDAPDVVCEVQTGHGDAFDFMRAFGYKVYKLDRNGVPVVYSVEGLFKKGDYLFAKGSIS
jgi:FkbM family methyltransferase